MSAVRQGKRHVLFVHGVGTHSRLSSLLNPWQALRTDTRNSEAATPEDDLLKSWELEAFADGAAPPHLRMRWQGQSELALPPVFFYEVNYSLLAGVVRSNHALDLTDLFVGFDLAVNVARNRLEAGVGPEKADGDYDVDLARTVQRLAGVFVAATVPILGLPSILFRQYTQNAVTVFTRFFEDIATFALDMNGQQLISAHVEKTVADIVTSDDFAKDPEKGPLDELVIVAHSLGTVVAHSYLVQRTMKDGRNLPSCVLTFGSPIGLVCWLWLFLDFELMQFKQHRTFDPDKPETMNARYFTWSVLDDVPGNLPAPIRWINVVNRLDPIATAFPLRYVNLAMGEDAGRLLAGGRIEHRFIATGDTAATAHTAYLEDRDEFLRLLADLGGLVPRDPKKASPAGDAGAHWRESVRSLRRAARLCWEGGLLAIVAYLALIVLGTGAWWVFGFAVVFACPRLTVGTLAFWQRYLCSRPTKRTANAAIGKLPLWDWAALPHRLAHRSPPDDPEQALAWEKSVASGPRPPWHVKLGRWLKSFLPTLVAMASPLLAVGWVDGWRVLWEPVAAHWNWGVPVLFVLFMAYVIAFAVSEFATQWRIAIMKATGCSPPSRG